VLSLFLPFNGQYEDYCPTLHKKSRNFASSKDVGLPYSFPRKTSWTGTVYVSEKMVRVTGCLIAVCGGYLLFAA
jgi:hypothetical protein